MHVTDATTDSLFLPGTHDFFRETWLPARTVALINLGLLALIGLIGLLSG